MKRTFLYIIAGIAAVLVLPLLYAYIAFPAGYVNRVFRWGDADVYDYQKFPSRTLGISGRPLGFAYSPDEDHVRAQFCKAAGVDNFDVFLEKNRTQAFIVIRNDAILYEKYFNGAARDAVVTSFSTAKSFTSALIGIAMAEGYIRSIDDPVTRYLPELSKRDPAFGKITIRNLLMMSSGIRYREFPFVNGDDAKTYYYPDLRHLALHDTYIDAVPGEKFLYNNYHPLLLGMILERATGMHVAEYLQNKIWKPAGMEYEGSWSLDESGFEKMESGINARAVDFAKFGRLFMHNGAWGGVQVVPAQWVAESTRADESVRYTDYYGNDFIFRNGRGYYKYMWWGIKRNPASYDFMALGNHGQFMYVSPGTKIIIVRFGESYGSFGGAEGWINLFDAFSAGYR